MCELFAMSASFPASVDVCMGELARHGGLTAPNSDGWGFGAYDPSGGVRLLKEAEPASTSDWIRTIRGERIRSTLVLSHIRRATRGGRSLANTQPFRRELGGRFHLFAHNGDLEGADTLVPPGAEHLPVGETDSERAFCALLHRMAPLWRREGLPSVGERVEVFTRFAEELRPMGPANLIYSDGELLLAHGHRRRDDEGHVRPPGLHILERECAPGEDGFCTDGVAIESRGGARGRMVVLASVPLTDEAWSPVAEGAVVAVKDGRLLAS